MKAQIWKIYISDGVMDAIHGGSRPIFEMYIPDMKMCINYAHYFSCDSDKYSPHEGETIPADLPDPELVLEIEELDETLLIPLMVMCSSCSMFKTVKKGLAEQFPDFFKLV